MTDAAPTPRRRSWIEGTANRVVCGAGAVVFFITGAWAASTTTAPNAA